MVWSAVRSLGNIPCPLPSSELPANWFLSSRRRPLANCLHEIQWNDFVIGPVSEPFLTDSHSLRTRDA